MATVVVGYDGSGAAGAAVREAARRAGPDGKVFVVHSYALPPDLLGWPYYNNLLTDREAYGRSLIDKLLEGDALANVDHETELLGGPPADAILDVARARGADEIVLGARGLSRLRSALGSVSSEVIHGADRPVTVIPAGAADDDPA